MLPEMKGLLYKLFDSPQNFAYTYNYAKQELVSFHFERINIEVAPDDFCISMTALCRKKASSNANNISSRDENKFIHRKSIPFVVCTKTRTRIRIAECFWMRGFNIHEFSARLRRKSSSPGLAGKPH